MRAIFPRRGVAESPSARGSAISDSLNCSSPHKLISNLNAFDFFRIRMLTRPIEYITLYSRIVERLAITITNKLPIEHNEGWRVCSPRWLTAETNTPNKSLHRILSEQGNTRMNNLATIFSVARKLLGVKIRMHAFKVA